MTTGNLKLQQDALAAAERGATVLTATGRLARHLLHRHRLGRAASTFRRPGVLSLNSWMHRAWQGLWPQSALAPALSRLGLWQRAADLCPPPPPLAATLSLLSQLDETYEVLVRHGLDPARLAPGPPLAEWRAEVCAHFARLAAESGLMHPAHLPAKLAEAVSSGRLVPPPEMVLAAIQAPAPAEERLFAALAQTCRLTRLTPGPPAAPPRLVSLPRLKDEVEWCAQELLRAAGSVPLHEMGVVVPSVEDYGPEIERALGELLGPRLGEGWAAWNIAAPRPLSEAPLVRAALLPLRLAAEEEPRELLLALITSPHYGRWQGVRHLVARADRSWRRLSVERGLRRLLATTGEPRLARLIEGEGETLSGLLATLRGRRTLPEWLAGLRGLWRGLGFPQVKGEADARLKERLSDALERLELAAGPEPIGLGELRGWLEQALSAELMDAPGFEHAGVQVLGLIEAAGLSFERLYVLGLHERGLPRPVKQLPLLRPEERQRVRGATWESQLEFARQVLANLLAAGAEVCLCRPRLGTEPEDEPLLPSPLWPELPQELVEEILFAGRPAPPWPGFPWLEAARAKREMTGAPPAADFDTGLSLPPAVRATGLESLLACPFAFLAAEMLGLEPLEEPRPGVSPRERGTRLHRALACYTRRWREAGGEVASPRSLLEECVAEALSDLTTDPFWELERRRWLGEGEGGGLLAAWLAEEADRLGHCVAEEREFSGLRLPGCAFEVCGQIDRLDGEGSGLCCWDYKTGREIASAGAPLVEHPQLAAYGLALRLGLLGEEFRGRPLAGLGYVHLPSEGKVALRRLSPPGGLEAALAEFAAELAGLSQALSGGLFLPAWERCLAAGKREWQRCPHAALCGLLECFDARPDEEEGT